MSWGNYLVKPALKGGLSVPVSSWVSGLTGGPMIREGVKAFGMNIPKSGAIFLTSFIGAEVWEWWRDARPQLTTGNVTSTFLEEEAWATLTIAATNVGGLMLLKAGGLSGINWKNAVVTAAVTEFAGEWIYGTALAPMIDMTPSYA
jgi:hypothetical protein